MDKSTGGVPIFRRQVWSTATFPKTGTVEIRARPCRIETDRFIEVLAGPFKIAQGVPTVRTAVDQLGDPRIVDRRTTRSGDDYVELLKILQDLVGP